MPRHCHGIAMAPAMAMPGHYPGNAMALPWYCHGIAEQRSIVYDFMQINGTAEWRGYGFWVKKATPSNYCFCIEINLAYTVASL